MLQNNQHAHRDAFNDSVPEKSIDGSFGGSQYGSGISSNLVSGAGRTGTKLIDLGHEKTWFKTDGSEAETIPGQKNGFSLKRSFSNREAPKSINLEAHRQPRQSITNIRNNVMSGNWKNSEEEEFTWDEMNTGLTDHGPNVSSNLSTDSWMTDDENLVSLLKGSVTLPFVHSIAIFLLIYKKKYIPLLCNMILFGDPPTLQKLLLILKTLALLVYFSQAIKTG